MLHAGEGVGRRIGTFVFIQFTKMVQNDSAISSAFNSAKMLLQSSSARKTERASKSILLKSNDKSLVTFPPVESFRETLIDGRDISSGG